MSKLSRLGSGFMMMLGNAKGLLFVAVMLLTAVIWAQPLSGGPRVPSILLMLLGGFVIAKGLFSIKDRRWQRFFIILALFWLPALISLVGSYAPEKSIELLVLLPLYLLFAAATFYLLDKYVQRDLLLIIISTISVFWLADGMLQLFLGQDLFGVPINPEGRIVGPFAHHLRLSLFVTILSPIVLQYLERHGWVWQLIYLAVAVMIAMLSGVRTDLLTILLATGLYTLGRRKFMLIAAIIPIVLLAGIIATGQSDISDKKLKSFSSMPSTYVEWNELSSYRLDIWSTAWNMFSDNPIAGVGARAFSSAYDQYKGKDDYFGDTTVSVSHAHHPIISIVAETGVLGLVGLFFAISLIYRWGRGSVHSGVIANPWLQILILMIFPIQSMPILFSLWWFPVVSFVLICYLNDINQIKSDASSQFDRVPLGSK
jgi:O-antigen ligase